MEPAAIKLALIFLLLTVLTASVAALGDNEAVMDFRGRPVKPKKPYLIQPAGQPDVWVSRHKRYIDIMCPQVAVLSSSPLPVRFLLESGSDYVPLSTNLSIMYDAFEPCPESGIWRVDQKSPFPTPEITAAGSVNAPDNTFKIEKNNDVYKIVYESYNIGVYTDPTTIIDHFVLNETPLDVIFVPANEPGYYKSQTSSFLKTMVPFIY